MSYELVKFAIGYTELGWSVFPIVPNTKRPLTRNGFKDATTNTEQIRQWWEKTPNANIGIATGSISGIVVIDIDVKNGANGFETLERININTDTLTAITPSGGRHLYYYLPEIPINSRTAILPGIDIKSEGGYVLAPCSVIDGKRYKWLEPEAHIIKFPQELLTLFNKQPDLQKTNIEGIIPQGERNATLTSIAGTLRRKGLTSNEIFEMLRIINANRCKPPLTDNELETISLSISRYPPQPDTDDKSVPFTEDALAIEFSIKHKDDWRYVAGWGSWLHWDGMRWKKETTLKAFDLARKICRQSAKQCDKVKKAEKILSAATVAAVERLARADRAHASTSEQWDSNLFAFNTQSGVLDTKTGAISPHSKQYHITRLANAGIGTQCPNWLKFLNDITNGNTELCEYLSRVAGYCLTGSTEEHVLFFLYGTGANGKSVFLNTLCSIWGDYATHAPLDTFLENRSDRHPTDLAKLRGARLVIATEISHGKHWDEAKIKAITGGDTISARFMRQDFFDYKPQFKLLIAGNHKPSLRNVDEAMRRRIHLIPFTLTIPPEKRDPKLMERLLEERDGILGWAVNGCLKWQEIGLKPPQCVLSATQEYFESQDAIKRWLEDECILDVNAFCSTEELFNSWKLWAENNGEFAGSKRRFSDELERRGYKRHRYGNDRTRGFIGISTKTKPFQENIL